MPPTDPKQEGGDRAPLTKEEIRRTAGEIVARMMAAKRVEWLEDHPEDKDLDDDALVKRIKAEAERERQRVWLENWHPCAEGDLRTLEERLRRFKPN